MKKIILLLFICSFYFTSKAQNTVSLNKTSVDKPRLVVGIVVDQMRYDYLTRFYNKYGDGGFKRMVNEGFNCKNNHYNYIPTKTGPGHASIFTGTTPKYHGIIGNDWFDKDLKRNVYCANDSNLESIGTKNEAGKMSPHRMLASTFADENRLFTQMRGKSIGISLKDRGAVFPAGHAANAAYWFDFENNGSGNWVTSSFYMKELPKWVTDFNKSDAAEKYFKEWKTLYDINTYTESGSDLNDYERIFKGKVTATFPYDLQTLRSHNGNFQIIAESPFGNSLTTDFAIKAIDSEELGKDEITDVLTVSYSSTDKVGHDFGPNSVEIEDTYLRLDLDLERLFNALDDKVGKGQYTVFLTSDHGAPHVPNYLKSNKIPAGLFDESKMFDEMNAFVEKQFKVSGLILSRINSQIFLNHDKIHANNLVLKDVKEILSLELLKYSLIDKVYITSNINQFEGSGGYIETLLQNGHNQKRSGDMMFVYNPEVFKGTEWNRTGTDHHSGFSYDTHVPLLFFGKGIKQGETLQKTEITAIAPTISALLGISFPNAAIGQPLEFVLD
ncbi:alkaline phosphatase family protein [Sabulilitoribacter multivorans]|uniref:Alkaline phosphatase family protein n=1 Tax=Flaviramulus multivorans TaxID=1304750 RepID=A0ABS9IKQ3_9FLAO|nr:alkaline phosphatase PafA [Flaviramulus multivorans]MCF7561193.1 alkaline phosphatase family protein [Flaviramulus multivorans]